MGQDLDGRHTTSADAEAGGFVDHWTSHLHPGVVLSFYITHRVRIILQVKGTRGKDENFSDRTGRMYNKYCELMGFDVVIGKK